MKEPVLMDKRQEHIKFCKYASQLLERVSGKQPNTLDASLEDIRKADIVAQTNITYREKELMQLIHQHLMTKGRHRTCRVWCPLVVQSFIGRLKKKYQSCHFHY
jgi:HIV-1 Vpr-binding protein